MNQYRQNNELGQILAITNDIARKSIGGNYIYRGETQYHDGVSSKLYRETTTGRDVESIQKADLESARRFTHETDELAILTELQHFGGSTNLIDFTTDYLIALFFACDGNYTQDGRVILLDTAGDMSTHIHKPRNPANRVIAQKSVFVRPPAGYIEHYDIVTIPQHLKQPMLDYLRNRHGISTESIYNDLHGFIRFKAIHREAFERLNDGYAFYNERDYPSAIECYTEALDLNPQLVYAYVYRGDTYQDGMRDYDSAIADYNKAIELYPNNTDANIYRSRGDAHYRTWNYDFAIADYSTAIALNPNDAESYIWRGNAYYEKRQYDPAIVDYNTAIALKPSSADFHLYRGNAYYHKGTYDLAVLDYNRAISLNPVSANAYFRRGVCMLRKNAWDNARSDLNFARNLGADLGTLFRNGYGSVSDFQQTHPVTLPPDIVQMLSG